jgi:hypothetical protein
MSFNRQTKDNNLTPLKQKDEDGNANLEHENKYDVFKIDNLKYEELGIKEDDEDYSFEDEEDQEINVIAQNYQNQIERINLQSNDDGSPQSKDG